MLGWVNSLRIPFSAQKFLNSSDKYSPPLSDHKTCILFPVSNSIRFLNLQNLEKVSLLFFRKYTQHFREKSSVNTKIYIEPPGEDCCMGPMIFE